MLLEFPRGRGKIHYAGHKGEYQGQSGGKGSEGIAWERGPIVDLWERIGEVRWKAGPGGNDLSRLWAVGLHLMIWHWLGMSRSEEFAS